MRHYWNKLSIFHSCKNMMGIFVYFWAWVPECRARWLNEVSMLVTRRPGCRCFLHSGVLTKSAKGWACLRVRNHGPEFWLRRLAHAQEIRGKTSLLALRLSLLVGRAVSEIPTCARATFSSLCARSLSLWCGVVPYTDRGPASSFQSEYMQQKYLPKLFPPHCLASLAGQFWGWV